MSNQVFLRSSILEPLVFLNYTADLSAVIEHCANCTFVLMTLTQINYSFAPENVSLANTKICNVLNNWHEYSTSHNIRINPVKYQFCFPHRKLAHS